MAMSQTFEGVNVIRSSDMAFLLEFGGQTRVWVPRSVIDDPTRLSDGDRDVTVILPDWIVIQKEIEEFAE
jgi:hypothetical protein